MPTIPQRIASTFAFAVLRGRYGDVSRMAQDVSNRGNRSIARPNAS